MVMHQKRAEPYGNRSPWHTLAAMPASHARNGWNDARGGASAMIFIVMAIQVNLPSPVCRLGSRKERMGQPDTRHLHHSA